MRYLLDTHYVLWVPIDDRRIRSAAREIIENPANDLLFSVASLWEMAIKRAQGKGGYPIDPREIRRQMIANGYTELAIEGAHAVAVDALPPIHKDPFDRILIAQAVVEGITLLTVDEEIAKYPGPICRVS
jgi:PIN domain nuclease of toxin-antitoxin system